jgi:hypothetical protein
VRRHILRRRYGHAGDSDVTPVIFRVWPNGQIIALFPTLPGDTYGVYVTSYEHIGQHGMADLGLVRRTRPAKPEEYASLKRELEQGGYKLKVYARATVGMRKQLMANLQKARG